MTEVRPLNAGDARAQVNALEAAIREQPETVELEVRHHFSNGVYARELHIPQGCVLVGKIHKFENLNILSAGAMLLVGDNGPVRVEAPFTVVSPPGTKRAAFALTDCVWTTIHGTEETDVGKIEQHFVAQDEQEYLTFCEQHKQIGQG
jgi:hypothetical protein